MFQLHDFLLRIGQDSTSQTSTHSSVLISKYFPTDLTCKSISSVCSHYFYQSTIRRMVKLLVFCVLLIASTLKSFQCNTRFCELTPGLITTQRSAHTTLRNTRKNLLYTVIHGEQYFNSPCWEPKGPSVNKVLMLS